MFVCVTAALACASVHAAPWQPAPGYQQLPIWPGAVPDARPDANEEGMAVRAEKLIAGKPWLEVNHVTRPTLTVYAPGGVNTGAAVVVFPGGGYQVLAMDLEGTEVCDWLNTLGVTCILLKYRVPGSGPYWDTVRNRRVIPTVPTALQDAQRAMGLVRQHAAAWHIDPHKIGVLGFSAGGHLVASLSTHPRRIYPPVDAADQESCRPDFAVTLYPGHMAINDTDLTRLNRTLNVTGQTPPTLLLHAQDDPVDPVAFSMLYYTALRQHAVPAEMHLYAQGGHAFGLRPTALPITHWPAVAAAWLATIGMIPAQ